jgi:hypothetical protein
MDKSAKVKSLGIGKGIIIMTKNRITRIRCAETTDVKPENWRILATAIGNWCMEVLDVVVYTKMECGTLLAWETNMTEEMIKSKLSWPNAAEYYWELSRTPYMMKTWSIEGEEKRSYVEREKFVIDWTNEVEWNGFIRRWKTSTSRATARMREDKTEHLLLPRRKSIRFYIPIPNTIIEIIRGTSWRERLKLIKDKWNVWF